MPDRNGDLMSEIEDLRQRLAESEETLSAIRDGEVDALVVKGTTVYALEGADRPYRVLVEAMQQGAVTLTPDRSVIYCNAGFGNMVQRRPEDLIGEPLESYFLPADRAALNRYLTEVQATRTQVELTLLAGDGTGLPVLISLNLLPLEGVEVICLVITDLTEHRRNKELQATDRRKDEFLAMLAHELRNPLAPISNAVQMLSLLNKDPHSEIRWASDIISRQVSQMTRIVDDLLDVSRITRGKVLLRARPIDASTILLAALETSKPLIEARQHNLDTSFPPEALIVNADLTRMAQVVTNLLNNAAKYTEEGGEIRLNCRRDGNEVEISVRDNGMGIPTEMQRHVFELFAQVDRSIDRSQGGLGIGLTLVRSLVELHGGRVSMKSEGLGHGSEFRLHLPLFSSDSSLAEDDPGIVLPCNPSATPLKILVVDDNADGASTLATMMRAMGHQVQIALDGITGVVASESFHPDLVFLDIGLPGMNGFRVAELIRANPNLEGTLLVALTGYGDEQDRKRSLEAGFDLHLVKPLEMAALHDIFSSLGQK